MYTPLKPSEFCALKGLKSFLNATKLEEVSYKETCSKKLKRFIVECRFFHYLSDYMIKINRAPLEHCCGELNYVVLSTAFNTEQYSRSDPFYFFFCFFFDFFRTLNERYITRKNPYVIFLIFSDKVYVTFSSD